MAKKQAKKEKKPVDMAVVIGAGVLLVLIAGLVVSINSGETSTSTEENTTVEEKNEAVFALLSPEVMNNSVSRCTIGDKKYTLYAGLAYFVDDRKVQNIVTPFGLYIQQGTSGRWTFYARTGRQNDHYKDIFSWVENGQLPNGDAVECDSVGSLPFFMHDFIEKHWFLYNADGVLKQNPEDERTVE